jgi:polysaccharide deacetylase 2 family uncharacterized protein YibQ
VDEAPGTDPVIVTVPEGSEFARSATDRVPQMPAPQSTPIGVAPVQVATPVATPDAALAVTDPGARPEAGMPAPAPQTPPDTPMAALDTAPIPEAPVPVPPPGEVETPQLPLAEADTPRPVAPPLPAQVSPAESAPSAAPAPILAPVPPAEIVLLPDGTPARPYLAPAPADPGPETPVLPAETAEKPPVFTLEAPSAGFTEAPGVLTNRLPRIGAEPTAEAAPVAQSSAALTEYAAPFVHADSRPLYSVVLIDPGVEAGGLDRNTLKTIGFPVTIALDPMRAGAAEAARDYRAAGFEVAILAAPLPQGATAADLEVALESWRAAVPEAVALVEPARPVMQNNRLLAQQLTKILAQDGLGLVTQDQGLNAASQLAATEGLPQTVLWRVLDTNRDRAATIERTLSRAVFEAQRDGHVAVMLSAWPESVAGLMNWAQGATGSVALAPVSALALQSVE